MNKWYRLIVFFAVSLLLFSFVDHVVTDKTAKKGYYGFRYEKKDTIDIVFLGNSHANNGFLPMELWKDHGYTSYSLTQISQTFPLVYYSAEEALELQSPKLLVVDLFAATSLDNQSDMMHKTIDNLIFPVKLRAIKEFVPKDNQKEYYFPFILYHDRWDELELKDFIPYRIRYSPKRNARKGATLVSDHLVCRCPDKAIAYSFEDTKCELTEDQLYWYSRLKSLCDKHGASLLFVVIPYEAPVGGDEASTVVQMDTYHATESWCKENGVAYLNLFRNIDEMEFDFTTDMQDVSHVNVLGAEKVTKAVGEYIFANYEIGDYRNTENIRCDWDGYYESYLMEKSAAVAACYEK